MEKRMCAVASLILGSVLFVSCFRTFSDKPVVNEAYFRDRRTLTIAVMPIGNTTDVKDLESPSRKLIYGFLSTKNYKDIEIKEIDRLLAKLCIDKNIALGDLMPYEIGNNLDADLLLYVTVRKFSHFYALVYSHIKAIVDIKAVDANTDNIVYKNRAKAAWYKLSLPFSPFEFIQSSIANIWALRNEEKHEVLEYIFRNTVETFPEVEEERPTDAPIITALNVEVPKDRLGNGDQIEVSFVGTPKHTGYFTIKGLGKTIRMKETDSGVYSGSYTVEKGDNANFCLITARVTKDDTASYSVRTDLSKSFAVDTQPPNTPNIYNFITTKNGLLLFYDRAPANDIDRYVILRRKAGQASFSNHAQSRDPFFFDAKIEPRTTYYYRVKAIDTTENESRLSDQFRFLTSHKGGILVDKDIVKTYPFYAYSSPYYVDKPITVSASAELVIEPDVTIIFGEKGTITIEGELRAVGRNKHPIKFVTHSNTNNALTINSANKSSRSHIINAEFTGFKTALMVGQGIVSVKDSLFAANTTGAVVTDGNNDVNFFNCHFRKNVIGLRNYSDNIVVDQTRFERNHIAIRSSSKKIETNSVFFSRNTIDVE